MELARGREFGAFDRSIDVQISRLRKLLEEIQPSRCTFKPSGGLATCLYRMAKLHSV